MVNAMVLSSAFILHDDDCFLEDSIVSFKAAGPLHASISRTPRPGEPGVWEETARIRKDIGAEVEISSVVHKRSRKGPLTLTFLAVFLVATIGIFDISSQDIRTRVESQLWVGQPYESVLHTLGLKSRNNLLVKDEHDPGYWCVIREPSKLSIILPESRIYLVFSEDRRLEGAWEKIETLFRDESHDIELSGHPPK